MKLTANILDRIIKKVAIKVNPFSGNCGIFAIGLNKFLNEMLIRDTEYMVYFGGVDTEQDFYHGEPDIYHIILSVNTNDIDDFFDGHGSVTEPQLLSILKEYGENFDTTSRIVSRPNKLIETTIRNNTNFDSGSVNEQTFYSLLNQEYKKLKLG